MSKYRKLNWSVAAVATLAMFSVMTSPVMARGGRGGGGFHGGGFHGGGFHGGGHYAFHPYRPSQHHFDHHNGQHDHHVYNHHHHNWHRGGWGPGFWGGTALGYGLGYGGWGSDGGDTYIDNSTAVSTDGDDSDEGDDSSDDQPTLGSTGSAGGFPTDDWPELGINTYAGQYGGTQGQVVVLVVPNSAAAKAGIVAGDVILSFNGQPTPSANTMETILGSANGQFTIEVWDARTGRKSTLSGKLDSKAPTTGKTAATPTQQK